MTTKHLDENRRGVFGNYNIFLVSLNFSTFLFDSIDEIDFKSLCKEVVM